MDSAQDALQEAPNAPQGAPRRTQDGPRRPQDGPRCAQDGPRRPQDGPKMAQSSPKTAPRRPKTPPRRPQDGPKRLPGHPRFPQDAPGPPQTPQNPPGPAPGTPKKANFEWEQGRPRPHKSTHQLHSPPASSAVAESRGSATGYSSSLVYIKIIKLIKNLSATALRRACPGLFPNVLRIKD